MSLHLLDLNEDVLHHIAGELYAGNALRFSLSSKRAYEVAIHRVAPVVKCRRTDRLVLIHQVLLSGPRPRAQHIEDLALYLSHDLHRQLTSATEAAPQVDNQHIAPIIPLTLDLISNAPRLRRLTLCEVDASLERYPHMQDVLRNVRNLNKVEFAGVGTGASMRFLQSTEWNLTVLSLGYSTYLTRTSSSEQLWRQLLGTLPAFPHLHTLDLTAFPRKNESFYDIDGYTPPTFPALRRLFLRNCYPAALHLACLSPNLHTFRPGIYPGRRDQLSHVAPRIGRLSPSRAIMFHSLMSAIYVSEVFLLSPSYHLRITDTDLHRGLPIEVLEEWRVASLMNVVRTVSPVRMQLAVVFENQPVGFCARLSLAAPRLRYLELRLTTSDEMDMNRDYTSWWVSSSDVYVLRCFLGLIVINL